jgi:hypothetical protein
MGGYRVFKRGHKIIGGTIWNKRGKQLENGGGNILKKGEQSLFPLDPPLPMLVILAIGRKIDYANCRFSMT